MKMRQLKKVLSITLASAMLLTSVPTGSMASEQSPASQEAGTEESTPAPAVETPAPETPTPETPAPETPAPETPTEEMPAPETPSEETTPTETPSEETPAPETPTEETLAPETPTEEITPTETPSEETTPTETPSEEAAPTETPTEETTPTAAPSETTPTAAPQVDVATTNMPAAAGIAPTPTEIPVKTVDVNWDNTEFEYDGYNHIPVPSAEGIEITCELLNATEAVVPGEYKAIAKTNAKNVELNNEIISFRITKAKVKFEWNESDLKQPFTGKPVTLPTVKVGLDINKVSAIVTADPKEIIKAGTYTVTASLTDEAKQYYSLADDPDAVRYLEVVEGLVKIQAESAEKYYGTGKDPELKYLVTGAADSIKDEIEANITLEREHADVLAGEFEPAGMYKIVLNEASQEYIDKLNKELKLNVQFVGADFIIKPLDVKLTVDSKNVYYGQKHLELSDEDYSVSKLQEADITTEQILKELKDSVELTYNEEYIMPDGNPIRVARNDNKNYSISTVGEVYIHPLPIRIDAKNDQFKYYGEDDPILDFEVSVEEEIEVEKTISDIKNELMGTLTRVDGENVGLYEINKPEDKEAPYYKIRFTSAVFEIRSLPIVIEPENTSKYFSGEDPEISYNCYANIEGYTITEEKSNAIEEEIRDEVILTREPGEIPKLYKYILERKYNSYNIECTLNDDIQFEIKPLTIDVNDSIDSRSKSFTVKVDNLPEKRLEDVTAKIKVNVDTSNVQNSNNISWSDLTDCVTGNLEDESIRINPIAYSREGQTWEGYFPAGAVVTVDAVYGKEETSVVKNKVSFTVNKHIITDSLSLAAPNTNSNGQSYVIVDENRKETITLSGAGTELKKVVYQQESSYYPDKNGGNYISVVASNSGSSHNMQTVTAEIMDTLNLICEPTSMNFYVDDQAFPIPSSSIQFENRGKEIKVTAPENGTITSVSIPNATVTALGDVAAGQEATFAVNWSGSALIPTGSSVSVTYKDEAGHDANGSTTATRSSVSTPLLFTIRPELTAGYLNGESSNLIVSGTGCTCEPISVSVAGMSQDLNVSVQDTWTDSNGTWETTFSMDGLPEGQDFTISAEYKDVNGAGYSINARYDSFCADASVVSPIYEAMTHISGMVEPGTTVALVINGDTQKYKEMKVDRFGRFAYDDVPMLYGGEDSFDIYVRDIAGNTSIRHYEIPEPGDPFEVTGTVNPMGKFLYSAVEEGSEVAVATPVSSDDFAEDAESIELPLLMGMSYEVGTLTLTKSGDGFTVSGKIQMGEDISSEDYTVEEGKLYVYTSQPSIEDIKEHKGTEYNYGDTISLGNGTVWIVNESNMTILADDMAELSLYDYENSEIYAKCQER